jgi:hypothetical protein
MIGLLTRAFERRREIRATVERLIEQMQEGAWKHARDRLFSAPTPADRAFWHEVMRRIEAHDDRLARTSVRRRARG